MNRLHIRLAIFVAALVIGLISLKYRTGAILASSDQLVDDGKELLQVLQSVHDSASAQAAIPKISKSYKTLHTEVAELVEKGKAVDRDGGVTQDGLDSLKGKMASFQRIMEQVRGEYERITRIPDVSRDFWDAVRGGSTVWAEGTVKIAPPIIRRSENPVGKWGAEGEDRSVAETNEPTNNSVTPEVESHSTVGGGSEFVPLRTPLYGPSHPPRYDELVAKYGKDQVVRVQIANQADIVAQMDEAAQAISNAAPGSLACELTGSNACVAPVDDFGAFCQGLDFAEIVSRDDEQKTVSIKIDPAKMHVGGTKLTRATPGRSPEAPQNTAQHQDIRPRTPSSDYIDELPNPSDPEYHKKLCDLMVSKTNWYLNDKAIDALLQINPHDVQDKDVRKQIARSFRDLAMGDKFGEKKAKAIQGLAMYGGSFSVPILIEFLENERLHPPSELFDALALLPDARSAEALSKKLGDSFCHDEAVDALRKMGPIAEDALIKAAPSDNPKVSLAAVELLGEIGTQSSLTLLGKASKSTNSEIRETAKEATAAIRGRSKKPTQ